MNRIKNLFKKCRCCLQNIKDNEKLEIGEIIREKFFEMTSFSMSYSSELSQMICFNCFSILSRYTAMKKCFIENQNMLNELIKRNQCEEVYVKVEIIGEQHHNEPRKDDNQRKKIESLYRVEEVADDVHHVHDEPLDIENFSCSSCAKSFRNKRKLKDHIERVHFKFKNHKCEKCSYRCFSLYELSQHKCNVNHQEKKFLCHLCGLDFNRKSCMIRHKNIIHLKQTRFTCDLCSYKTYKKDTMKKHISTHLPKVSRNLSKCKKCSIELSSIYALKLHEKNFHRQDEKQFRCIYQNCDKSFSREITLKDHVKFVHLKCRPYNCDKCEQSFSSKSHLKRHHGRKHKDELINSNNLLV